MLGTAALLRIVASLMYQIYFLTMPTTAVIKRLVKQYRFTCCNEHSQEWWKSAKFYSIWKNVTLDILNHFAPSRAAVFLLPENIFPQPNTHILVLDLQTMCNIIMVHSKLFIVQQCTKFLVIDCCRVWRFYITLLTFGFIFLQACSRSPWKPDIRGSSRGSMGMYTFIIRLPSLCLSVHPYQPIAICYPVPPGYTRATTELMPPENCTKIFPEKCTSIVAIGFSLVISYFYMF